MQWRSAAPAALCWCAGPEHVLALTAGGADSSAAVPRLSASSTSQTSASPNPGSLLNQTAAQFQGSSSVLTQTAAIFYRPQSDSRVRRRLGLRRLWQL